jgi:hypothetical protein
MLGNVMTAVRACFSWARSAAMAAASLVRFA